MNYCRRLLNGKKYHPPFFFATQLTINLCNDADLMDLIQGATIIQV
jgi:hypothetical protein